LSSLRPLHAALALLIVAVWGTNFVVIKIGLRDLPPFFFAFLRFTFSAVPFVFFMRRPDVPLKWLAAYGVLLGAGQFGLLYFAMLSDVSPGLASLIMQTQVPFTIILSVLVFHEKLGTLAVAGTALAIGGLALIGWHLDATVTARGVVTLLMAAFCWACANIIVKKAARDSGHKIDILAFIVWSSVFAMPPLLAMSLAFEGYDTVLRALHGSHWDAWVAVAWQALGNTLFCFAAWSWLLTRYDAAVVTPYALLIPVFGMGASALILGEPFPPWKFHAAALVLGGIAMITLTPLLRKRAPKVDP
jgi:O-acetylserine/cysteine efflux transporter